MNFFVDKRFSNFNFYILANEFLGVGMPCGFMGSFPEREGWIKVLAGLAPFSQTIGSSLKNPWLAEPA